MTYDLFLLLRAPLLLTSGMSKSRLLMNSYGLVAHTIWFACRVVTREVLTVMPVRAHLQQPSQHLLHLTGLKLLTSFLLGLTPPWKNLRHALNSFCNYVHTIG